MLKVTIEVQNLANAAQNAKIIAKEEAYRHIKALEIQRQKYIFESKYESLIEVADAIIEGVAKIVAIYKGKEIYDPLKDAVQRVVDKIVNDINYLETIFLSIDSDSSKKKQAEINDRIIKLQSWQKILQSNPEGQKSSYEIQKDLNTNTSADKIEYINLQKKIEEDITREVHFFKSVERIEIKEINKYFDKQQKTSAERFTETLKRINSDLVQEIAVLKLTTEVNNISLDIAGYSDSDHPSSTEDMSSQTMPLAGHSDIGSDSPS